MNLYPGSREIRKGGEGKYVAIRENQILLLLLLCQQCTALHRVDHLVNTTLLLFILVYPRSTSRIEPVLRKREDFKVIFENLVCISVATLECAPL